MAEIISLERSDYNILGLTNTLALLANEAQFFRFRVFFGACSLQNKVGDPPFFCLFSKSRSLPFCVASCKKSVRGNILCANVLKESIKNRKKALVPLWFHPSGLPRSGYTSRNTASVNPESWSQTKKLYLPNFPIVKQGNRWISFDHSGILFEK